MNIYEYKQRTYVTSMGRPIRRRDGDLRIIERLRRKRAFLLAYWPTDALGALRTTRRRRRRRRQVPICVPIACRRIVRYVPPDALRNLQSDVRIHLLLPLSDLRRVGRERNGGQRRARSRHLSRGEHRCRLESGPRRLRLERASHARHFP